MSHARVHAAVDAASPRFIVRIRLDALSVVVKGMVKGGKIGRL